MSGAKEKIRTNGSNGAGAVINRKQNTIPGVDRSSKVDNKLQFDPDRVMKMNASLMNSLTLCKLNLILTG